MLRNRLIIKKIRNICILLMAIIIMIGVYTNIRRSRAENVIPIALEVSDKSETLEMQTIMVDATETQDGNYLLDLPTSVNGNIVTKYYTSDGTEVLMNDENADKTLTLTQAEVSEQKIQLQTNYDKKEVTTEDGQTITLYNKELMDVKEPEENTEEGTNDTEANETENNQTPEEGTTEETNLGDSVIVTGYMPLEAQVDINEIDLATLSDIQLPSDTQTMQKAYEVSVYQTFRTTIDPDGNVIAEEIEMPQSQIDNGINNETEENTTNNTTDNMAIENINSENARENENVQSVTEGTTPDNTTITTITLKDGTTIEEEKIEYDPSIYNEELTIKTKNTEANTTATVYGIQEDNQIQALENTTEEEYVDTIISKDNQTVKYLLATEPIAVANDNALNNEQSSNSEVSTMALTDGNYLRTTNTETQRESGFLGNTSIQREDIDNVTFVSSTSGKNSTAWDVSEAQDGSIMAWYTTNSNGTYKVYIGSNETIYANPDSSYLFSTIGYSDKGTATEKITNIGLLNTSNVTNMSHMFSEMGYEVMTSLDLGDNFDTSKVTNMDSMFFNTGFRKMTSLNLGDSFDTSNVTDMRSMFQQTGYNAMTSLDLGNNFDTSHVTNMQAMFMWTGYYAMTSLKLGTAFTNIASTNSGMFFETGKSGEIVIKVLEEIYQDSQHVKVNENSSTTIEFTRGTFEVIASTYLRTTNTETEITSGFLGNTSIQRQNIDNVTFVSSTSRMNNTAWDVSEKQNRSIMAWYTTNSNGTYKVYIGSDEIICANPDSSYLFSYIGRSEKCTSTETITNINFLKTSNVTNMMHMFYMTGYNSMTSLDLGDKFDTSNVTNMNYMFAYAGFTAMTKLDLGDNFDTSNVQDFRGMFYRTGYTAMTSLDLGDKFDTNQATDMSYMFYYLGHDAMKSLELGPAFTKIANNYTNMFEMAKTGVVIQASEAIYQNSTNFKLNANSSTTINFTNGTINPKYRTEWTKQAVQTDTTDANNPKLSITLKGTTNPEIAASEYKSDVTSSLTADSIKVFIDNTDITDVVTKTVGTATQIANTRTGAQDVVQVITLSDFEEATLRTGKSYKEWSGNIRLEIAQGTLKDTYGSGNIKLETDGNRADNVIEDTTKFDKNTSNAMFGDFVKPGFVYNYSSTDIDHDAKTLTVDFSVTDKYFNSSTISSNAANITVKMLDTNVVPENLTTSLRKVQDITETRDGASVKIGEKYRLTISGFEKASIDNGKYKEYSGPVSIVFPAGMATDKSGNSSVQTNITVGVSEPNNTGNQEIVDFIEPGIEKISSTVNIVKDGTAELVFQVTDKYLSSNTLSSGSLQVLVNGEVNTSITKQLTSTNLTEQRVENGTTSSVRYGTEYTLTLTGIDTTVNQIKVRIPAGTITDTSGNGNQTTDFILFNTLRNASTEQHENDPFLGNAKIQRQMIENVTFVDNIPEDVYDVENNTFKDSTAWDVSAQGDNSIIAWYDTNANETYKVYIGSNDEIFGNVDSSYLFNDIALSRYCTATEVITNIDLLNTSNVTNMRNMFENTGYNAMTSLDLGDNFDTSSVTNMIAMFAYTGRNAMTSLDLGDKFDTSNVTEMVQMFRETGYTAMTSLNLGENFDTRNVTNMDSMFDGTGYTAMRSLDLGDKFDTSSVTNMNNMFEETGYTAMTSLDLGDKFDTSQVTTMSYMFQFTGHTVMTSLDLGDKFDTSNVTNMYEMFYETGYEAMTSLNLGDKFDTSKVTNMAYMFHHTGYRKMTTLDLGDKFDTSNVTDMTEMFESTGTEAMTNLDLGPAFTNIASTNTNMFSNTGKSGCVINAPEAIYQNSTKFKLNTNSSTAINYTRGTINPKYRTEWVKETVQTNKTDANNPKLNITLRGTTNTEVAADEYISDVTSSLTANDIKIFIDDTEITDIVTKTVGTATQTNNTRTGAKDVLQVLTLSNFEEATRRTGKSYKEWSGNIRIEVAQGTLSDTTGPADETGKKVTYGNKNMEVAEDGSRIDNSIEDETKVDQNTEGAMFADFIKPEFTYEYSSTDIDHDAKTLTVEFSVTDKYFNSLTMASNASNITVKMLDTNAVPENITKTLTKVSDITETRDGSSVKIGETYRLVISGLEQASIAEDGKYKEYSGPMSIVFPAGIASDKSGNTNNQKNITVGINEPDQTGDAEIVDVVDPVWEARNFNIDKVNNKVTVDLYGTDKYFNNSTLNINNIKVILDGTEITSTTNVTKQLSTATPLTETRDGASVQYGVKYTLTLSNWVETDSQFESSGRIYREYSGYTQIQIAGNTLADKYGNQNQQTTLDLGKIDLVRPEIKEVSSSKDDENKTETIVFDVTDKDLATVNISTTDTSKIHVYVDNEEATGVTKTITSVEDLTAMVNGSNKVVGKRYTLVLSNFEQERTTIDYNREYSDWSGNVSIEIDARTAIDNSGNYNTESLLDNTNNNLDQTQKMDKKILIFGLAEIQSELSALQTALQEKYTTVELMTVDRDVLDVDNQLVPIANDYDLVICDTYLLSHGGIIANQDNLNYNLITISNDADIENNQLIGEEVSWGDKDNSEYIVVTSVTTQPGILEDMTIYPNSVRTDNSLYKVKFKDDVNVLATLTYRDDSNTYDAIGYKMVGEYKQIHSQFPLYNSDYTRVVSRLVDFSFDNVGTIINGDFVDFIKPNATYQHSETDIDYDGKTYQMVFDMTDKFYTSGTLTLNDLAIRIDGEEPDWTKVSKSLQEEDIINTVNGENKVIGKRYTLTLSNLQQLQVKEGDNYLDYSGVVTVAIPANKILDTTGNGNNATTITSGINLPGGEAGDEEVVDVVNPTIEKTNSSVNIVKDGTAEVTFRVTDKYFANSTLTNGNIQVLVNGSTNTNITKQLTSTPLTEQRMVNGVATDVQYGAEYTLKLTGIDKTNINQVKVRIPEGAITDTSGNGNEETEFMIYNALRSTSGEIVKTDESGDIIEVDGEDELVEKIEIIAFLGKTNISRQNIDNITFMDHIPETVYDVATNTYKDSTAWDVSAAQDNSIIAWYETNDNGTMKVYIGSNDEIFGNINSSCLFAFIGDSENCTATETITNINLLNTSNVTNMSDMFRNLGYHSMTSLDLGENFDTSNVTNMAYMFIGTGFKSMTTLNLGDNFDTSNVTDMTRMFYCMGYNALTSLYLGENFDTSNVTTMDSMFTCTGYELMTSLDLGENFDTSKVTNMRYMFQGTGFNSLISLDLGDKFNTSNVTNMERMFYCTGWNAMTNLDLGNNFDTSQVTNMVYMFNATGYTAMTSLDLGDKFDTSQVTDMNGMFYATGYLEMTSFDLGDKFDTSNVTNMSYMFYCTGWKALTNLDLGDKFDTSKVTNMSDMFRTTGYTALTSLDLGDKFNTSQVTDMSNMFFGTGFTAMTSLDLGPAFTNIAAKNDRMFYQPGKSGEIVIQAPEAIYNDKTHFKLSTDSNTTVGILNADDEEGTTYGTINPKYRTEWIKEGTAIDETEANNPKLNITLRGTTNTEVDATEYISDVTSSLTANDIKVFIDDTEITDIVTKTVGTATQTANTRTGAQDVIQVITLSNFEEATRQAGKLYKEWSGNVRIEIAQGTLSDTTGPADETGKKIPYGNKNIGVAEDGTRIDNKIEDEEKLEQNTEGAMFVDFIEPEFTYEYSSTDINYDQKTLTVEFSVTDKYFNSLTIAANASNITVKMLDTNAVPENITKTITKVEDIKETRNGQEVKIGETYRLVISGLEQASIAEDGKYKEYSGPMSIVFPAGIASDKSENTNNAKNITIGINEPDQTGDAEIVDVVDPMWEVRNLNIDKQKNQITVDLYGTDKYYENSTLDVSKIKVIIDAEEITSTTNVLKQLSAATPLTETRDGATVQYGVKYTLTLSNWIETDSQFEASGRIYREYSGETEIQIQAGTLVDESGNENIETTLDLGKIDVINPEIMKVSSTIDNENKTETIVFDVVDKDLATVNISTTDTSTIHVYVDNEEAIGVTKTITNIEDLTAMVNGSTRVVGKRYTLVLSNFEQPRTTIDYDREFSDWSGDVMLIIESGTAIDGSGNPSTDQQY